MRLQMVLFFILATIILSCSETSYHTPPEDSSCTIAEEGGYIFIRCPDGTWVDITPIPVEDTPADVDCTVEELEDSYLLICGDTEVEIPKFEDDDNEHPKELRCKKFQNRKYYKCNNRKHDEAGE